MACALGHTHKVFCCICNINFRENLQYLLKSFEGGRNIGIYQHELWKLKSQKPFDFMKKYFYVFKFKDEYVDVTTAQSMFSIESIVQMYCRKKVVHQFQFQCVQRNEKVFFF